MSLLLGVTLPRLTAFQQEACFPSLICIPVLLSEIFVDNQGASRILTIGSPKPHLQEVLLEVLKLCFRFGISIEAQWLPRGENLRADLLSRFIEKDD